MSMRPSSDEEGRARMPEPRSKRTETEDTSRVDYLLGLLGNLSRQDPSPALRERLSDLAVQRLKEEPESAPRLRSAGHRSLKWLKPVFVAAMLVVIGLTTIFVAHIRQRESLPTNSAAKVGPPAPSPRSGIQTIPAMKPSKVRLPKIHQPRSVLTQRTGAQRMTMRLPYSNYAIETVTPTPLRVPFSQPNLLSPGFPAP